MTNVELETMIETERANLSAAVLEDGRHWDRYPTRKKNYPAWDLRREEIENSMLAIVERIEVLRSVLNLRA